MQRIVRWHCYEAERLLFPEAVGRFITDCRNRAAAFEGKADIGFAYGRHKKNPAQDRALDFW